MSGSEIVRTLLKGYTRLPINSSYNAEGHVPLLVLVKSGDNWFGMTPDGIQMVKQSQQRNRGSTLLSSIFRDVLKMDDLKYWVVKDSLVRPEDDLFGLFRDNRSQALAVVTRVPNQVKSPFLKALGSHSKVETNRKDRSGVKTIERLTFGNRKDLGVSSQTKSLPFQLGLEWGPRASQPHPPPGPPPGPIPDPPPEPDDTHWSVSESRPSSSKPPAKPTPRRSPVGLIVPPKSVSKLLSESTPSNPPSNPTPQQSPSRLHREGLMGAALPHPAPPPPPKPKLATPPKLGSSSTPTSRQGPYPPEQSPMMAPVAPVSKPESKSKVSTPQTPSVPRKDSPMMAPVPLVSKPESETTPESKESVRMVPPPAPPPPALPAIVTEDLLIPRYIRRPPRRPAPRPDSLNKNSPKTLHDFVAEGLKNKKIYQEPESQGTQSSSWLDD